MRKILILLLFASIITGLVHAQKPKNYEPITYTSINDIYYRENITTDQYINEQCRLDLYFPSNVDSFTTIVWFHGGGLTGGEKSIPEQLENKKLAVVSVNYRLSPKVKSPAFIDDAAAATAWVFKNIRKYGGNDKKIIISGHSAGGYLTCMIGLDKSYLLAYNIDADKIYKLVPFSGQMISHFTIRKEQGIKDTQPTIDSFAPLFHVRKDAPPLYLITGNRELELLGRYEENAYMSRMMKIVGHKNTFLYELDGFDHGSMANPAFDLLLNTIKNN